MAAKRITNKRTSKRVARRKPQAKLAHPPVLDAAELAELRKQLGDFKKESRATIPETALQGTLAEITKLLTRHAKANGFGNDWKVGRYRPSRYGDLRWCIVGLRPFTDEELAKDGAKLLKQKQLKEERAAKQREKDLLKFSELADKLGVSVETDGIR